MDSDAIMTVIVAIIGSGVLNTLINQICSHFQRKKEEKNGMNAGMRLIMKDRLRSLCVRYISQGWIYADELEDLIAMHECYHNTLGGNGYLNTLMENVKKLTVKGVGVA